MDDRTLLRIVSEASALCGYASTCRTGNSVHWMEGLAEHLNRFSNAMGWKARYKLEQGILLEEMEQLHGGDNDQEGTKGNSEGASRTDHDSPGSQEACANEDRG